MAHCCKTNDRRRGLDVDSWEIRTRWRNLAGGRDLIAPLPLLLTGPSCSHSVTYRSGRLLPEREASSSEKSGDPMRSDIHARAVATAAVAVAAVAAAAPAPLAGIHDEDVADAKCCCGWLRIRRSAAVEAAKAMFPHLRFGRPRRRSSVGVELSSVAGKDRHRL
jgi:hypothetical protein